MTFVVSTASCAAIGEIASVNSIHACSDMFVSMQAWMAIVGKCRACFLIDATTFLCLLFPISCSSAFRLIHLILFNS